MSNTSLLTNNGFKGLEQRRLYWEWGSGRGKGGYGITFAKLVIHKSILLNYVITLSRCLSPSLPSPAAPPPSHLLILPEVLHNSREPALLPWSWCLVTALPQDTLLMVFGLGFFFFESRLTESDFGWFQFLTLQVHNTSEGFVVCKV